MFALRIEFHDGVSAPETLLIRRSDAIVGTSEGSHVVLEGATSAIPEFSLVRGLGREFYCRGVLRCPLKSDSSVNATPNMSLDNSAGVIPSGAFDGVAELELGEASTRIWCLDLDLVPSNLLPLGDESPDKAALRTLKDALSFKSPIFPALVMIGESVGFYSFRSDMKMMVGRSRRCLLRTDSAGIANEHACIWCEGKDFLISPTPNLGNDYVGVYVNEEIVTSGSVKFAPITRVRIGTIELVGLQTVEDLQALRAELSKRPHHKVERRSYPAILVKSSTMREIKRFAFGRKSRLIAGRDPACDIWLQDVHVSSEHMSFSLNDLGDIIVVDSSTNGTFLDGNRLGNGESIALGKQFTVFNLQLGLEISVCFTQLEESKYFPDLARDEVSEACPVELPIFQSERAFLEISQIGSEQIVFSGNPLSSEHRLHGDESKSVSRLKVEDPVAIKTKEVDSRYGNSSVVTDKTDELKIENSIQSPQSVSTVDISERPNRSKLGREVLSSKEKVKSPKEKVKSPLAKDSKLEASCANVVSDSEGIEEVEWQVLSGTQKFIMGFSVFGLLIIAVLITVALLTK